MLRLVTRPIFLDKFSQPLYQQITQDSVPTHGNSCVRCSFWNTSVTDRSSVHWNQWGTTTAGHVSTPPNDGRQRLVLLCCCIPFRFVYDLWQCIRGAVTRVVYIGAQDLYGSLSYQTLGFPQVVCKGAASFSERRIVKNSELMNIHVFSVHNLKCEFTELWRD